MVSADAENCIAVTPGANGSLLPDKIEQFSSVLDNADMLIMQAEIPYETTKLLAIMAKQKGVKVLLNPAPACAVDPEFMSNVDILVVNETEAELISQKRLNEFSIEDIAQTLLQQGAQQVLITLGSKGLYLKTKQEVIQFDAFKVKAIDTTAAGDTFCGALAVACACKEIDEQALRYASAAAAISVTRLGAQPAIPTLTEVEDFLQKH
jgi:ribokinase